MNIVRKSPALVVTGPRQAAIIDMEVAPPREGEVLVRALATGFSAGTEMNVYRGAAPQWRRRQDPATRLFVTAEQNDFSYPLAYGYACYGVVEAVGPGLAWPTVGEHVFALAPHRLFSTVPAAHVLRIPQDLAQPDVAVMLANLNTAYNGVLDARPVLGADVVVFGLGILGQLVVRLLRMTGVRHLVAVDTIEARRALARAAGATHALDPRSDSVAEIVRELTGNRGADVVIEVSGAPAALNEAIRTVGVDGTVVAMSWYNGSFADLDLMGEFHHNRARIRSSQVAAVNPDLGPLWSVPRRLELASDLLGRLDLAPLVSHRVPFDQGPEMYRLLDQSPDQAMQVILDYTGAQS